MKFLAVLFFGIFLWTQQALAISADVLFYTKRGEPFQVILDGRLINRTVTDQLHLHDIPGGFHRAEIRFPDRFGALVYHTRIYLEPGFKTDFVLSIVGRRPRVIMNKAAAYPLPVVNRPLPGRGPRPDGDNRDDYDEERDDYNGRDHDNRRELMQPADVDRLIAALKKRPFDDDKMVLAKQVLGESTFYAEDLKAILMLFSFDNKKLELAKSLYYNTYDRRNFYVVYDAFRFDSDRRELERYISSLLK